MKRNIFLTVLLMMTLFTLSASASKNDPANDLKKVPTSSTQSQLYTYHIAYITSAVYPTLSIHVDYNSSWDYNYAYGIDGNIGYIFDTLSGSFSPDAFGVTVYGTLGVTYWNSTASGYIEVAPGYYPYAF